jgi:hypothetical protein
VKVLIGCRLKNRQVPSALYISQRSQSLISCNIHWFFQASTVHASTHLLLSDGATMVDDSTPKWQASVTTHSAHKSLAALHQPICSTYFYTEPLGTGNKEGQPLPWIRNSENCITKHKIG